MQNPVQYLKKNPFVLAPMAGITDHAFRTFMRAKGAGVVVTELVSATGIKYASEKTLDLMTFDSTQHPVAIQLFGEDPEILATAAQVVQEKGADFVDLNFGCPVPKVVKKGAGSAMLKDLPLLEKVLRSVKSAVQIPVTIKIRTGWDANTRNAIDVCQIAHNEGMEWVAIHGRTRAQAYAGQADWDFIAEVKAKTRIPIIGNGDITSPQLAVKRLQESGCDGVMIGRGCLKNPFIFEDALTLWQGQPLGVGTRNMAELFRELERNIVAHCDEHLVALQLKKFASWYSAGYPGASNFRKLVFQTKTHDEIMSFALEFFSLINKDQQEDTSHEDFLMGGHG